MANLMVDMASEQGGFLGVESIQHNTDDEHQIPFIINLSYSLLKFIWTNKFRFPTEI